MSTLFVAGCAPSQAELAATARVAIQQTQTARPTETRVMDTATPEPSPTVEVTPTASFGIGSEQVRAADSMKMLYVPEGEFQMGWNGGANGEYPEHTVRLDAYWIDKTEVTTAQYQFCVSAGKCKRSTISQPSGESPVVNVAWRDADAYCSYVGARLPTEAEWEKAARGTDGRIYPWGSEMDKSKLSTFTWDSRMPAVGQFPDGASPYGVLDMAGGAFEWVADWYSPSYYGSSPAADPQGPNSGRFHVIRGGWWEYCPTKYICKINPNYRSTFRNGSGNYGRGGDGPAWVYYPGAGFRCAADASGPLQP
jgi:formylglycine-generating enzyme required for sulfatase activity